jgi:hypothetical protein
LFPRPPCLPPCSPTRMPPGQRRGLLASLPALANGRRGLGRRPISMHPMHPMHPSLFLFMLPFPSLVLFFSFWFIVAFSFPHARTTRLHVCTHSFPSPPVNHAGMNLNPSVSSTLSIVRHTTLNVATRRKGGGRADPATVNPPPQVRVSLTPAAAPEVPPRATFMLGSAAGAVSATTAATTTTTATAPPVAVGVPVPPPRVMPVEPVPPGAAEQDDVRGAWAAADGTGSG